MTRDRRQIIIGLTGLAGSGKDTVGEYLEIHRGFERDSFAAPIRKALAVMGLGTSMYDDKDYVDQSFQKSWRDMARSLGTEWGRNLVCQDLWILLLIDRVWPKLSRGLSLVVTDVRFANEANYIRAKGGTIWRITRPGWAHRCDQEHVTEAGVARIAASTEICNDGTLEELYEQVDAELLRQYGAPHGDDVTW
jgi:hypothetical protein